MAIRKTLFKKNYLSVSNYFEKCGTKKPAEKTRRQ